jgi:hypothetical protein
MNNSNEQKTETAKCRGCGKVLNGKPYYMGGSAFDPKTKEEAKSNFYGGFVCSESCDYSASQRQEESMPGVGKFISLSSGAQQHIRRNWKKSNQ